MDERDIDTIELELDVPDDRTLERVVARVGVDSLDEFIEDVLHELLGMVDSL